jgi:hypothetical protein
LVLGHEAGSANMPIYHYTSAAGLQGIIESKSFWTTDHRFLNDPSEFKHGWAIVLAALMRRRAELDSLSPMVWNAIEAFQSYGDRNGIFAFVGSLTTEGDLLSQWRGYGGGKGFAIGFNIDWLSINAQDQGFHLHPVVYTPEHQLRAADDVVTLLVRLLSERKSDSQSHDIMRDWWMHALKVALVLKDQNFREEQEQRLLWIGLNWPPGVSTRVTGAGLVPYRSCRLDRVPVNITLSPQNIGIEDIIVGPGLGRHQIAAVDALLAKNGMRTTIRKSAIPFIAD